MLNDLEKKLPIKSKCLIFEKDNKLCLYMYEGEVLLIFDKTSFPLINELVLK